MRLIVVGSGTSEPQPETSASGLLVETETTAILVDCGQGVVRELLAIRDPRQLDAVIVGHMHADHYLDLVALRYLLPWKGVIGAKILVLLPPDGRARIGELAAAISERPSFFDDAFEIVEYDPAQPAQVGELSIAFVPGQHYIPSWGFSISDPDGRRVVISGDTGPTDGLVAAARGADLLVVEATLASAAHDDQQRGHLTADEALDVARRAGVPRTVLVHHRLGLDARIEAAGISLAGATAGEPGLVIDVDGSASRSAAPDPDPHGGDVASRPGPTAGRAADGIAPVRLP